MSTKTGIFVPLPEGYKANVRGRTKKFDASISGLYITYNFRKAWINYAGPDAGECYDTIEIPCTSDVLREFAAKLEKLAMIVDEKYNR